MCGIFGFVAWDREMPPARDLCAATNLLRHRGPDGGGYWQDAGVFFGHRRLAIIDLSTGEQPMASAGARYVITFNGEIYNYPELREELRNLGATFQTASDTEAILAGYAIWGTDVVARLEGMFAFALYDRMERTLLLARDRFGEKPLLFSESGGRLTFASEMSPLVSIGAGEGEVDAEALGGYLCLNYVPGTRTMMRGIERLAPSEWRLYGSEGLRRSGRYWSAEAEASTAGAGALTRQPPRTLGETLDELQERLDRAVRLTLRSDVPVGLFLSGGVDSSLVAHAAARLGRLEAAFCVDVTTEGFSEWEAAANVAQRVGVELVRVPVDAGVLSEFMEIAGHLDDPLADSSAMNVWSVSRAASQRLKVVLSGDGGDELFGGYLTYAASQWHARLRPLLPAVAWRALAGAASHMGANDRVKVGPGYKLQRFLRAMPLPSREAHFTWNGTWLPSQAAALASDDRLRTSALGALHAVAPGMDADRVRMHDFQITDIREYLVNDILTKVDRATMGHGLESRAPLLNSSVAAFALSLPERLRMQGTTTKVVLRELCARHFGRAHAYAPKQGFSIPVHSWLRHEGRAVMTGLLAPERVTQIGLIDSAVVTRVMEQHLSGRHAYGWELWGLMVLVAWFEARVSQPPEARLLPEATDLREVTFTPTLSAHGRA